MADATQKAAENMNRPHFNQFDNLRGFMDIRQ
jgi:hypothetical protein